ncbi:hypothetical protein M7M4_00200 [Corynebacterium pseudogenitalium]
MLVTESIGKEIEAGEVGAVRFLGCAKFHKIHDRRRGGKRGVGTRKIPSVQAGDLQGRDCANA